MNGNRPIKNNDQIAQEWNDLANDRLSQLKSGADLSMDHILIPILLDLSLNTDLSNVIDLGCGTGYASKFISDISDFVTGIDISAESIEVANANFASKKLKFIKSSIEDFSLVKKDFSLGICNMTLMDVSNLSDVLQGINKLLKKDAYLIITITHPYFWPFYWNYAEENWFDYSKELEIENPFKISSIASSFKTTHYHRPLSLYLNTLVENNFSIEQVIEPMPNESIEKLYPSKWKFPRFLAIKCRRQ